MKSKADRWFVCAADRVRYAQHGLLHRRRPRTAGRVLPCRPLCPRTPFDIRVTAETLGDLYGKKVQPPAVSNGDFLLAINGVPFTGEISAPRHPGAFQDLARSIQCFRPHTGRPGARGAGSFGLPAKVPGLVSGPRHSPSHPDFRSAPARAPSIGYWVVAARPRDLNAWLVLLLARISRDGLRRS